MASFLNRKIVWWWSTISFKTTAWTKYQCPLTPLNMVCHISWPLFCFLKIELCTRKKKYIQWPCKISHPSHLALGCCANPKPSCTRKKNCHVSPHLDYERQKLHSEFWCCVNEKLLWVNTQSFCVVLFPKTPIAQINVDISQIEWMNQKLLLSLYMGLCPETFLFPIFFFFPSCLSWIEADLCSGLLAYSKRWENA